MHTAQAGEAIPRAMALFGSGCGVIIFVHGPDATLARDLARAAAVDADPSGENTSWLDGKEITLQGALAGMPIPLHPGAEKYFREKGMVK